MVQPANVDETPLAGETPAEMVLRLSRAKATELSARGALLGATAPDAGTCSMQAADIIAASTELSDAGASRDSSGIAADRFASAASATREVVIIAADTTVALDGLIIGKPKDAAEAEQILRQLRRRMHQVFTGLTLASPQGRQWTALCETRVHMRAYGDDELLAYIASGEVYDKAGAYAIQDTVFHPVDRIEGCYMNVMGLPLCEVIRGLRALGIETGKTEPIPHN